MAELVRDTSTPASSMYPTMSVAFRNGLPRNMSWNPTKGVCSRDGRVGMKKERLGWRTMNGRFSKYET